MVKRLIAVLALVVASAGITVLAVNSGQSATASVASTPPPVTSNPGAYFNQGDLINLCVNWNTEAVRVELHSSVLGNCTVGEVQLTVEAMPDPPAVYTPSPPIPQP